MLFFKPISTCAVVGLAVAHHGLAAPVLLYRYATLYNTSIACASNLLIYFFSTSRGCSGSVFQAARCVVAPTLRLRLTECSTHSGGYCTLGFDMFGLAADISRARQAPWGHGMRTRSVA